MAMSSYANVAAFQGNTFQRTEPIAPDYEFSMVANEARMHFDWSPTWQK